MQRNITLSLDDDLFHKVRTLAARRNRSISALLREELSRLVVEDETYQSARQSALKRLERGTHLGGGPLPARKDLQRARLR